MPKVKAQSVIWDFDGTIFDSMKLYEELMHEVLPRHGMVVPSHEAFIHNAYGRLRDSIHGLCGAEGSLLDEIYQDFIDSEEQYYVQPGELYHADAIELMQQCHELGLPQIIVSNRWHHSDERLASPRNLAARAPLKGLVDHVVCADDNDFWKPDARLLDKAEQELGLDKTKALIVGDQFVDAELAHNLRSYAVLVSRTEETIPHLEKLADGWESHVQIVRSLHDVSVERL